MAKKSKKIVSYGQEWTKPEITFLINKYEAGYNRNEIAALYKERFKREGWTRSPDSIKNAASVYCAHVDRHIPKVLFLDIETSPHVAYVWQQFENNVDLSMLINDGAIISFSAKWAGTPDKDIVYFDQRGKEKNLNDDKLLMKKLWNLLDEADIVCGHNLRRFDIPKINSRFIQHGLEAPSSYKIIDTLSLARSYFGFFSNKLAFLSSKLAKTHKKDGHGNFPGFKLWDECMKGNKEAWKAMEHYNKLDVLSLEEVFLQLAKYAKNNKLVTSALRNYKTK